MLLLTSQTPLSDHVLQATSRPRSITSPVWGFSHPARLRVMMAILKQGGSGTPRNLAVRWLTSGMLRVWGSKVICNRSDL